MPSHRVIHQFLYRIRTSSRVVLQFNKSKNDLVTWFWPVNEHGERVPPSDLRLHRLSHDMLGPCCLCPLQNDVGESFVESTISMVGHGLYAGEYVATCAKGECDYFVFIERIYGRRGVPIRHYPLRDINDSAPLAVMSVLDEDIELIALQHDRRRRMEDINMRAVRICNPPTLTPRDVFEKLLSLNSASGPGIPSVQFENLFARCQSCDLIMTRRIFQLHDCVLEDDVAIEDDNAIEEDDAMEEDNPSEDDDIVDLTMEYIE